MATRNPRSHIISISDLPWEERQAGVKRKLLWEDPATKRRAIMNRIEPSAQFSRHRHVGDELIFVIEGALSDEFGTVTAGNMGYRPHGCVHAISTKNGATVLFIITGSTEPATERGHAPPSEIFALHELPWVETGPGVRTTQNGATVLAVVWGRTEPV
jgi:quercetin dioxygenase-like cupin family protein